MTDQVRIALTVNGSAHTAVVSARQLLVSHLRDDLGLTGTKIGCDTSSCGACTVLLDGDSVKSCTLLAVQADGRDILTIEGLAAGRLAGLQQALAEAFTEQHALQCGFCTPGMLMALVSLLREQPGSTDDGIRQGLDGNLCRCTGYTPIVRAALSVARAEDRTDAGDP